MKRCFMLLGTLLFVGVFAFSASAANKPKQPIDPLNKIEHTLGVKFNHDRFLKAVDRAVSSNPEKSSVLYTDEDAVISIHLKAISFSSRKTGCIDVIYRFRGYMTVVAFQNSPRPLPKSVKSIIAIDFGKFEGADDKGKFVRFKGFAYEIKVLPYQRAKTKSKPKLPDSIAKK